MAQENNQNIGMTFIHLNKDLASKLYTSIIEMFNLYKTIVPDGLYLLSALATGNSFCYKKKFWDKILSQNLTNFTNTLIML